MPLDILHKNMSISPIQSLFVVSIFLVLRVLPFMPVLFHLSSYPFYPSHSIYIVLPELVYSVLPFAVLASFSSLCFSYFFLRSADIRRQLQLLILPFLFLFAAMMRTLSARNISREGVAAPVSERTLLC